MSRVRGLAMGTVAILAGLVACWVAYPAGTGTASAGEAAGKKIVAGKATYQAKGGNEHWKEKGRIVGLVRQCPGCKVEALDAEGKNVAASCTVAANGRAYELQWLSPGTYQLRVTADGYEPLVVPGLAVKADNDLRLNIEFEGTNGR